MSDVSDYTRESNLDRIIFLRFYHVTLPSSWRGTFSHFSKVWPGKCVFTESGRWHHMDVMSFRRSNTTWKMEKKSRNFNNVHHRSKPLSSVDRNGTRSMKGREFSFLNQFILIESCTAWGFSVTILWMKPQIMKRKRTAPPIMKIISLIQSCKAAHRFEGSCNQANPNACCAQTNYLHLFRHQVKPSKFQQAVKLIPGDELS